MCDAALMKAIFKLKNFWPLGRFTEAAQSLLVTELDLSKGVKSLGFL